MSEKNGFELVRKPSSAVEKAAPGAKHILSGMVADALVLAQPIFTVLSRQRTAPLARSFIALHFILESAETGRMNRPCHASCSCHDSRQLRPLRGNGFENSASHFSILLFP